MRGEVCDLFAKARNYHAQNDDLLLHQTRIFFLYTNYTLRSLYRTGYLPHVQGDAFLLHKTRIVFW